MSQYWSADVHALQPYVPGEQPKGQTFIKLNTNENPYPPCPAVRDIIRNYNSDDLRLYPDPESTRLRESLANLHDLNADQIFVGNGSDEVLAHSFYAFFRHEKTILFPDISYSFYPVYCGLYKIDFETIPLDSKYEISVADYNKDNGGIILPNPNAPTGIALELDAIRSLVGQASGVVIIDEAYVDFGAESAVSLINEFDNLLVIRTFSKARSLAGLRLGYAIGQANLIEGLNRVKDSFNSYPINRLSSEIAIASIEDKHYFEQSLSRVVASRQKLTVELESLGFTVFPSRANFIFVSHPDKSAQSLAALLREEGILVRYFNKERIDNCLRISIGTEQQCDQLNEALTRIFSR